MWTNLKCRQNQFIVPHTLLCVRTQCQSLQLCLARWAAARISLGPALDNLLQLRRAWTFHSATERHLDIIGAVILLLLTDLDLVRADLPDVIQYQCLTPSGLFLGS